MKIASGFLLKYNFIIFAMQNRIKHIWLTEKQTPDTDSSIERWRIVSMLLLFAILSRVSFTMMGVIYIDDKPGVYQIISSLDNKKYVGSAVNLRRRKWIHFSSLNTGKHRNRYLQNYVNKSGLNVLKFFIIEHCGKESLIEREQYYINIIKPEFNICKCAGNMLGFKHSEETKQKISKTHRGKPNAMQGRKHSRETRKKMSEINRGKNNGFYGKHHSEESKQKISKANKEKRRGRLHSEEAKRKISLANTKDKVKYNCDYCEGENETNEYSYKIKKRHFCNHKCYALYRVGKKRWKGMKKLINYKF